MINGFYQNNTNNHFLFGLPVNNNNLVNTTYYAPKNNIAYANYPSQYIINNQPYKIIPTNNTIINPIQNYNTNYNNNNYNTNYYYNSNNNNQIISNTLNNATFTNYQRNYNIINQPNTYQNNLYLKPKTSNPIFSQKIENPKRIIKRPPSVNKTLKPTGVIPINNNINYFNTNIAANNFNKNISPVENSKTVVNNLESTMRNINLNNNINNNTNIQINQPKNITNNISSKTEQINKASTPNSTQNNNSQENQISSKENITTKNKEDDKNNNKTEKNIKKSEEMNKENSEMLNSKKEEIQKRPLTESEYNDIFLSGVGLRNLGNTCYINSPLQVLIHCKLFIQSFLDKYSLINKFTTPISYEFYLICISMSEKMKNGLPHTDISNFKEVFGKKHPIFNDFSQNDSQEFCRHFLEDLSMELNEAKNKDIYKVLTNSEGKSKLFRDKEFEFNFKEREISFVTKLFYSQIITTFKCQCGSEIYSFQKLLDFPLLLPNNIKEIDIYDLFNTYFKNEKIDFQDKCQRCKKVGEHIKMMKISRPPEILIISFQRTDEVNKTKNECIVNFPQILNLTNYIDHEIGFDKEAEYKLFSVVNHQGNVNFGHYFSYIQPLHSQNWFLFNDSQVKHVKEGLKSFPNAYALFYIKKKHLPN